MVVAGYSLGANVLPFAINRFDPQVRAALTGVVLIAPGRHTTFEFHLSSWLGAEGGKSYAVTPEILAMPASPPLRCVSGSEDDEVFCPALAPPSAVIVKSGDHHFDDDYAGLAAVIVDAFAKSPSVRK